MSTSSGTPESWISSFCSLLGHEYFAEVSEEFIEDDFNLTGLQNQVAMYKEALEVLLLSLPGSSHGALCLRMLTLGSRCSDDTGRRTRRR
jgi:hypothetical protein